MKYHPQLASFNSNHELPQKAGHLYDQSDMSPIAVLTQQIATVPSPAPKVLPTDIPRRPSPWHEIAHSLSTTSLPPFQPQVQSRRLSSSATSVSVTEPCTPSDTSTGPCATPPSLGIVGISTSQALREWEERLSKPQSDVSRHQLIPKCSNDNNSHNRELVKTKLAAERDKAGFIEYKLKLIDPTPERFERLVTQMMWRLKQGRNEAIYELGLADDGTVIGLPRSQMDASLRTLESMASEVGATVIILKEIVLHSLRKPELSTKTSLPSFNPSPSNLAATTHNDLPPSSGPKKKSRGRWPTSKRRTKYTPKEPGVYGGTTPKKLIFDPADLAASSSDSESDSQDEDLMNNPTSRQSGVQSEEDNSPFLFEPDIEDVLVTSNTFTRSHFSSPTGNIPKTPSKKEDKKRRKSAARSEARRLDLLRGDGTNPMWTEMNSSNGDLSSSNIEKSNLSPSAIDDSPHFTLPHQPTRPSSLRLTTPTLSSSEEQGHNKDDNSFLDDLLHIPLDNLSLSFADVRTIPEESENGGTSEGSVSPEVYQSPLDELVEQQGITNAVTDIQGGELEEMICVEALVVRKIQHDEDGINDGVNGNGEEDEDAEEWGYGGEEDVWGFGVDD